MAMAAKARRGGEKRVDLAVDDLNEAVSLCPDLGHRLGVGLVTFSVAVVVMFWKFCGFLS